MASKRQVPLEDILKLIFNKPADWSLGSGDRDEILNDKKLQEHLCAYTDNVKREQDRYQPFVLIANRIIRILCRNNIPFRLCRNDPVMVRGSDAQRFPDCVAVPEKLLQDRRRKPKNLGKTGPKALPFHWLELLGFFEFKMEKPLTAKDSSLASALSLSYEEQLDSTNRAPGGLLAAANIVPGNSTTGRAVGDSRKRRPDDSPQNPRVLRKRRMDAPTTDSSSNISDNSDTGSSLSHNDDDKDEDYYPSTESSSQASDYEESEPESPPKAKTIPADYGVQCASYAVEMLSRGYLVTHRFGFLITDQRIQMQYYDHSIILTTEEVDFISNPSVLVAIFHCLVLASEKELGRLDAVNNPMQKTPASPEEIESLGLSYLASSTLQCREVNANLVLGEVLFRQHAVIGRGTCVVRVTSDYAAWKQLSGKLVLKVSFQPCGRVAEGKRLEKIRDYVNKNSAHDNIIQHLPKMLHSEQLPEDTMAIQARLASFLGQETNPITYEMRDVQILVMEELLPIKNIKQGSKLLKALVGVVTAYKWLYETMGLMHRDLSVENMMYRLDVEGNVVGVLNDYDLAIFLAEQNNGPVSKQRTGTRPYMAIDLLKSAEPLKHLCRYDLESILYSVLDLACYRHASAEVQKASPIHEWFNQESSETQIAHSKSHFLAEYPIPDTTKGMGELAGVVNDLTNMFSDARAHMTLHLRSRPFDGTAGLKPFDLETMGGKVTLGAFAAIFGL